MRAVSKILRVRAREHSSNFCEQFEQRPNFAFSAGVRWTDRWTKTICRSSRVPQPMKNCHESHVNKRLFQQSKFQFSSNRRHLYLNDSSPSLNAVSRGKKSASVQRPEPELTPTKNRQVCSGLKKQAHKVYMR